MIFDGADFRAAVEAAVRERDENSGKQDPMPETIDKIVRAAQEYAPIYAQENAEPPCFGPCCGGTP
jgi:hypothetical protein